MKKPAVDYRQFRFSKLNSPEYAHLKLLFGWVVYFAAYFLTETFVPLERCGTVHCFLDDMIPFCEWFVIPYVFWYLLIAGSLVYFALYNVESFKNLSKYLIITQVVATIIYIVFPSRQDLRPEIFPRDNLATRVVALLYTVDTNTNVCPSLHVAFSLGIGSVWLKEQGISNLWKAFVVAAVILICLSTAFIKQHSAFDAIAAVPMCLLAEMLVFGLPHIRTNLPKK